MADVAQALIDYDNAARRLGSSVDTPPAVAHEAFTIAEKLTRLAATVFPDVQVLYLSLDFAPFRGRDARDGVTEIAQRA
jgi:hypothetical protein